MKTLYLFFALALFLPAGCNKDVPPDIESMTEQEIQTLFVGKWKETERGNDDVPEHSFSPQDYTFEFLPNGSVFYDCENFSPLPYPGEYTYRVDKEFLYFYYSDWAYSDWAEGDSSVFRYTFPAQDMFRMDYVSGRQV